MAEPVGIIGSAVGICGFGLQLYKEISQYLNDVDGRDEDLKQARNYATNLKISLDALDDAISNAPSTSPDARTVVDSCKVACVAALKDLSAVIKELKGPLALPGSHASKAKELYARLSYPFKKQNMDKLVEQVFRTNTVLQAALTIFQINTGNATNTVVVRMRQTIADVNVASEKTNTTLCHMHKTLQLQDDKLSSIQRGLRDLSISYSEERHSLASQGQQTSNVTSDVAFSTTLPKNLVFDTPLSNIQTTHYQGGSNIILDGFCSCKTQRTRFSRSRWGPFLLEAEIRSRNHHVPECPMSKLPTTKRQAQRVVSLTIPMVQKYWSSASKVSISYTTGAGILGLGQTMSWTAMVDEKLSPVFQMVRVLKNYSHLQRDEMHTLLQSCFRRFVWCYANSKASATDITIDNESILDYGLQYRKNGTGLNSLAADNIAELMQMLVVVTEPATSSNTISTTPIAASVATSDWFSNCTKPNEVAAALLPSCSGSVGHQHHSDWGPWQWRQKHKVFQNFPQIANSLNFGPLSRAVLEEDEDGVRHILKRYPSYINEVNYCGESPIHLAIRKQNNSVLGVVLQYADANVLNAKDNEGGFPIDHAIPLCKGIDQGIDVSSKIPFEGSTSPERVSTATHYFMASNGIDPVSNLDCSLSKDAFEIVFSEAVVDDCCCWCSPGGCTPLVKLLEGMICPATRSYERDVPSEFFIEYCLERTITDLLRGQPGAIGKLQSIYDTIVRYCTFAALDLRHVCCRMVRCSSGPAQEEEWREIQEEDFLSLQRFQKLLTGFMDALRREMRLEEFFEWMRMDWAPRMQDAREELASQRLTDEQLRDAESVGVVWEAYGPQLMHESSEGSDVGECDLWDAMDELDQIATDPERPMKEILHTHT
ncbi:hypothetical protein H9Q70_002532 [Fusarium xylarioides]|nr:hypothetical protein H9Q70_002532 [Fusarium xylarioides]